MRKTCTDVSEDFLRVICNCSENDNLIVYRAWSKRTGHDQGEKEKGKDSSLV